MDKQELINRLENLLTTPSEIEGYDFDYGHDYGIKRAITLAEQLDDPVISPEQEKPVVPKYVADWIEWCKKNKITLLGADTAICNNKNIRSLDAAGWAMKNQETFAKAWIYGYEVEKEKLYTAELPNPNSFSLIILRRNEEGKIYISFNIPNLEKWKSDKNVQLTESEIKEDFGWAWEFAEEVEE